MRKDSGGSAFPVQEFKNRNDDIYQYCETGMTLRDYFAAKAMQGMLTTSAQPTLLGVNGCEPLVADAAYKLADSMLKARDA